MDDFIVEVNEQSNSAAADGAGDGLPLAVAAAATLADELPAEAAMLLDEPPILGGVDAIEEVSVPQARRELRRPHLPEAKPLPSTLAALPSTLDSSVVAIGGGSRHREIDPLSFSRDRAEPWPRAERYPVNRRSAIGSDSRRRSRSPSRSPPRERRSYLSDAPPPSGGARYGDSDLPRYADAGYQWSGMRAKPRMSGFDDRGSDGRGNGGGGFEDRPMDGGGRFDDVRDGGWPLHGAGVMGGSGGGGIGGVGGVDDGGGGGGGRKSGGECGGTSLDGDGGACHGGDGAGVGTAEHESGLALEVGGEEEGELEEGEVDNESDLASLVVADLTEPWMDEAYVQHIFHALGRTLVGCRVARDWLQESRPSLGYAVVQLSSHRAAAKMMKARGTSGLAPLYPHRYVLRNAKSACSVYVGQLDAMPWVCPAMLRYIFADEQVRQAQENANCRESGNHTCTRLPPPPSVPALAHHRADIR